MDKITITIDETGAYKVEAKNSSGEDASLLEIENVLSSIAGELKEKRIMVAAMKAAIDVFNNSVEESRKQAVENDTRH